MVVEDIGMYTSLPQRLRRISEKYMKILGSPVVIVEFCESCILGKQKKRLHLQR